MEFKEKEIKRLPLYLEKDIKNRVKEKAESLGLTSNSYIKMLILKDLEK